MVWNEGGLFVHFSLELRSNVLCSSFSAVSLGLWIRRCKLGNYLSLTGLRWDLVEILCS